MTTINLHELDNQFHEANKKITSSLAIYQKEGSGWILDEILHMDLSIAQYTPLKGSSWIYLCQSSSTPRKPLLTSYILIANVLCRQFLHLFIPFTGITTQNDSTIISVFKMNVTLMESGFLLPSTKLENSNAKTTFQLTSLDLKMCCSQSKLQKNASTHMLICCYAPKGRQDITASSMI